MQHYFISFSSLEKKSPPLLASKHLFKNEECVKNEESGQGFLLPLRPQTQCPRHPSPCLTFSFRWAPVHKCPLSGPIPLLWPHSYAAKLEHAELCEPHIAHEVGSTFLSIVAKNPNVGPGTWRVPQEIRWAIPLWWMKGNLCIKNVIFVIPLLFDEVLQKCQVGLIPRFLLRWVSKILCLHLIAVYECQANGKEK